MRGVTDTKPPPPSFATHNISSSSKNLFSQSQKRNAPLGRSIRPSKPNQPSRLSKHFEVEDVDDEDLPARDNRTGTFAIPFDDSYDDTFDETAEDAAAYEAAMDRDVHVASDAEDMWLGMQQGDITLDGDESDLMMHATPAANERIRKEAEDIFRVSTVRSGARRREFKFAPLAKDLYTQLGYATITESPELILNTEAQIRRLYDDGVGVSDDAEKLDETLANVAAKVAALWNDYAEGLPKSNKEHAAVIGPGPHSSNFEKANYLASLALQIHHTRFDEGDQLRTEPLTETLFRWLDINHNFYPEKFEDIQRHRPSPACHGLFWETVFVALLRGKVAEAQRLLKNAGWGHVRKGHRSDYAYTGQSLSNVERAVAATCEMLAHCPGIEQNWDIWSSDWTLFRIRARGQLEQLRRFAEGRDTAGVLAESNLSDSTSTYGRQSMAGLARKAESQVPWDIYENLNIIFEIVLGSRPAILAAAQDWCEATVGLFGWWDEDKTEKNFSMSRSQNLMLPGGGHTAEGYLDRLARSFQTVVESDFPLNTLNSVEVGMACVFEGNTKGLIGLLRAWSLPIAAAVAEIASLGGWLPPHKRNAIFGMEDLDMDDLDVLGMDPASPDEVDGIKDNTLITYAQELSRFRQLSSVKDKNGVPRDGWELAIHVLGRMDSPERSEETVGQLVKLLMDDLDVDSGTTVDKVWRLLNELGMIPYAEETAETYGEILARDSHRYGEAMWYYALAHKPSKVREVMNLLISYSLLQSTPYPPTNDLDDHLHKLLANRNETLRDFAAQDLEAAELLGKMLSGYASLRQFYELRDHNDDEGSALSPKQRRRQAAAALAGVVASADDNIRGGLFDASRDAIVSEDFLLALLGEASVFVSGPDHAFNGGAGGAEVDLDQIDVLLKAVEDLESVGDRVYRSAEEFFQLVLASVPGGLRGSTPADLMRKSAGAGGSFVLAGSQVLAGKLQRSISGGVRLNVRRGWDWRREVSVGTTGKSFLRRMRVGLTKDLARLWLEEADGGMWS
ncbi:hypothetical protein CONLIGDRAFT_624662 [Coniochaeta ligniaria NRRL 30616]|uniref:Nuclear pore complex protein Nup85 n=1 Tax=Coniochaeta ligniaria NRRL 30616 TaxID=1408157 RepID=A0A1J7I765_9PEZI|nr:hypothetical protein CONLIGDRAFT_624662 [Coniochaeta ligniaria NRRL 30616]